MKDDVNEKVTIGKVKTFLHSEVFSFTMGLICLLVGLYMLLSFSSFFLAGGADQDLVAQGLADGMDGSATGVENHTGERGAKLSEFFINDGFGLAAYCIPLFLLMAGLKWIRAYEAFKLRKWFWIGSITMVWLSVTLGFACGKPFSDTFVYPGGLHGYNASRWLCAQIGASGLVLLLLGTAILIGVCLTPRTMSVVRRLLHPSWKRKPAGAEKASGKPAKEGTPQPVRDTEAGESVEVARQKEDEPHVPQPENQAGDREGLYEPVHLEERLLDETPGTGYPEPVSDPAAGRPAGEPTFEISNLPAEEPKTAETADEPPAGDLSQPYNPRLDLENYHFPPIDLLDQRHDDEVAIDMEEQKANKDRIIEVLRSFDVEISSIKASVGPTITLYEITPAPGVRISKIRNLENDIALSLKALGVRIIAPIPGRGTIGIEVPNANPHIVSMSSIITSKKFQETTYELPVALGKTITNEVFMVDLAKAPHMLVAGATGQGKSVGLNAIVTSLLYKKHPSELKFVIIDPKKVEFAIYAPIEHHYLAKLPDGGDAIITDVTKVVQTLNSLCVEMDTRYDLLRKAGCRNIKEYNAKFIRRELNPEKGHHFMPYIVIIIDEFGDLIMTAGRDVELPICRIAQLARAVGIHAIIATQRPTTNIITGTIKANFPARVAFKVASVTDSRTILDRPGAQQLIGKGDMLYLQGNDPVRVQCAFVDTPEVERIAHFISQQQGYPTAFMLPEYVDPNGDADANAGGNVDMNRLDPLFEEAARLLIYHQQGSTSLIQRKFSIGYNRAGRLMDQLEKAGIVGPANGSKARDVLCMDENDLRMRMENLNNKG